MQGAKQAPAALMRPKKEKRSPVLQRRAVLAPDEKHLPAVHLRFHHRLPAAHPGLGEVEEYMRLLKKQDGRVEEFNPELWCGLLDFVTVGDKLVFTFRDGPRWG